jgi:hypothetical protein
VNLSPRSFPLLACLVVVSASGTVASSGLQVRDYVQLQHDWFFGNPGGPFLNGVFQPSSASFRAVGQPDDTVEWFRHMALISPRHFVYATHYTIPLPMQLRFLGTGDQLHSYPISSTVAVKNAQNQDTDLMLGTLATEVDPSTGVLPFPVLNLANEAAYTGLTLQVFGKAARSSTMPLAGFQTLVNIPDFDTTRFAYFDYPPSGQPNDCDYEGGDSGCPTFIMVAGQPALVGTASRQDSINGNSRNSLSFIPAYLTQLDVAMEAEGYHVKRFYPATTTVTTSATGVGTLRRAKSGSVVLTAQNTGANDAHNVATTLTFSNAPTTVSGAGWICQATSPTVWKCRRGGITGSTSSTFNATWTALPMTSSMQVTIDRIYDGATSSSASTTLPLQETYTSWSNGLTDPAINADPDRDGFANLIEYSFGGSPTTSSVLSPDGRSLALKIQKVGSNLLVRYPRRTDAATRNLTYTPEVSTTLGGWASTHPSGSTLTAAAFTPASPGFEEVTLTIPISATQRFVRVKVGLTE